MGLFEAVGRGTDWALSRTWRGLDRLEPTARGALLGAAAGAAVGAARRKRDPVTGEKEPAGEPVVDGALKGLGLGAAATLAARGFGVMKKSAGWGGGFAAECGRLIAGRG